MEFCVKQSSVCMTLVDVKQSSVIYKSASFLKKFQKLTCDPCEWKKLRVKHILLLRDQIN